MSERYVVITYRLINSTDRCFLFGTPYGLMDVTGIRSTEIDALYDWEENHAVLNSSNHLNLQKTYRCNHLCELHQVRANRSPNTIRRNAFALAYYWEYLLENEKQAEDIYAAGGSQSIWTRENS